MSTPAAPSVSINVIVRNCPDSLERCLKSVYEGIYEPGDETLVLDTGSAPNLLKQTEAVCRRFKDCRLIKRDLTADLRPMIERWMDPKLVAELQNEAQYFDGKSIIDFAAARQVLHDASTKDYVFWIDADDILVEKQSGTIRAILKEKAGELDGLFMDYLYDFAKEDGACTTILSRERFVRREKFYWVGRCHETCIPRPGVQSRPVGYFKDCGSVIRHTEARKPHRISDIRNYCILKDELEAAGGAEKADPRTSFYLANACRGLGLFRDACRLYTEFDLLSGSEEDRFAAWYYMGGIYLEPAVRRPIDALRAFQRCAEIKPLDCRPYFGQARAYGAMHRYPESMHWYDVGCGRGVSQSFHSYDPTHIDYHPHVMAAFIAKEMGRPELALECIGKASRVRPKACSEHADYMSRWARGVEVARNLLNVVQYVEGSAMTKRDAARRVAARLPGVPPELERSGIGAPEGPDPRPDRPTLTFFCGGHSQPWGEFSAKTGIGGSEKMVLLLSRALQARGVNVTVYGEVPYDCRGVSKETGVLWRHWSEFREEIERDVLVLWRSPEAVLIPARAKKRVLWCHDVQVPQRYSREVLECVDLVQLQSQFHADPIRDVVPPDKLWVARNAIDAKAMLAAADGVARDPKKVIFSSSPDRGLLTAARIMRSAQRKDPELHLTVTYGIAEWARKNWANNRHRTIPDIGREMSIDEWECMMNRELDAIGARTLHMISFDQMAKELASSSVWLYPTRFDEISCMSAMEAQLMGVVPVCTSHGALAETVWSGEFLSLDHTYAQWANTVEAAACTDDRTREAISRSAAENFDIETLATDWINKLDLGVRSDVAAVAA